jgi:hypothetical protein
MGRRQPPRSAISRRRLAILIGAPCFLLVVGAGVVWLQGRSAKSDIALRLETVLAKTQAKMNERTRAKLIKDYLAIGPHRALVIAPKAQAHWWTGDWPTASDAEEKALERCQLVYDEICGSVAVDDEMVRPDGDAVARDMPRVKYAGDFDPAQIPVIRPIVATRADVVGYLRSAEPKAAAIHSRGIVSIVSGATTQRRAETQALKLCNDGASSRDADGPCYLYAIGNKVVLTQRKTGPLTKP